MNLNDMNRLISNIFVDTNRLISNILLMINEFFVTINEFCVTINEFYVMINESCVMINELSSRQCEFLRKLFLSLCWEKSSIDQKFVCDFRFSSWTWTCDSIVWKVYLLSFLHQNDNQWRSDIETTFVFIEFAWVIIELLSWIIEISTINKN